MEYYSTAEKRPQDYRKTIDLNNCEDMVAPLPVHSRQFVIKLLVKNGVKMRDYYFECSSESEMDNWVQCLAQVCGFSASKSKYSTVYVHVVLCQSILKHHLHYSVMCIHLEYMYVW